MVHGGPIEDDLIAGWRAMKAESRKRRAEYRDNAAKILRTRRIEFVTHNSGAHFVVTHAGKRYDFWPGTGLFRKRPENASAVFGHSRQSTGRGIDNFLRELGIA